MWGTLAVAPSAAAAQCAGDCDGNGAVAINEIILAVNIALGEDDVSACDVYAGRVAINGL